MTPRFFFELGISFLQLCLKRIVLNFQPDWSHPRRVNDPPKNRKNPKTDTRKKKIELGILFLHFCLKRIVLNFQPNRSHSRGVNDLPKNWENLKSDTRLRARNMFCVGYGGPVLSCILHLRGVVGYGGWGCRIRILH